MIEKPIFNTSPDYLELKRRVSKLEATIRGLTMFVGVIAVCFLTYVVVAGVFS